MEFKIVKPKAIQTFLIEKKRAGSIRLELWTTKELSIYIITEFGHSKLVETNKIMMSETIFKVDGTSGIGRTFSLASGNYYLVIYNKGESEVNFNFTISENFEPPGYSSVTGTSGTFIR